MKIIMIFQFRLILPKKLMSRTTAGMSGDERIAPPEATSRNSGCRSFPGNKNNKQYVMKIHKT